MTSLKNLLNELEAISREHSEIEDSDVRERMYDVIHHGFIVRSPDYEVPDDFGMHEDEGNEQIKAALSRFLDAAELEAKSLKLKTAERRLPIFEDDSITSDGGKTFHDFFGPTG